MLDQRKKYRKGKPFSAVTLQKIDKHATNVENQSETQLCTHFLLLYKNFSISWLLYFCWLCNYSKVPNKRTCTITNS